MLGALQSANNTAYAIASLVTLPVLEGSPLIGAGTQVGLGVYANEASIEGIARPVGFPVIIGASALVVPSGPDDFFRLK